jgi:hypothetical protein
MRKRFKGNKARRHCLKNNVVPDKRNDIKIVVGRVLTHYAVSPGSQFITLEDARVIGRHSENVTYSHGVCKPRDAYYKRIFTHLSVRVF